MTFFHFRQNNSGGKFDFDAAGISINVIIEAKNAYEANKKALQIGLYFDGVEKGKDCKCCGDRWRALDDDDGTNSPSIYGEELGIFLEPFFVDMRNEKETCVHFSDGSKKWFKADNTEVV